MRIEHEHFQQPHNTLRSTVHAVRIDEIVATVAYFETEKEW